MIKNTLRRLLLIGTFAFTIVSCGEDSTNTSVITSFTKFPVVLESSALRVSECIGGTQTIDFSVGEDQITDITIEVATGNSSTATEDVDFVLETHEIELAAFEGQEGFSVEVTVLEDFEIEDGDEDIYLVFTSTTPSGVELSETKVITIEDSGLGDEPASTVDFTLSWAFDDPDLQGGSHPCDLVNDLDMTFQVAGGSMYDDDLLGFSASTLGCPELATLDVADMADGEVYEVWIAIYAGIDVSPESPAITVYVDYARDNSTLNGTITIAGVFNATMAAAGGVLMTVEKNCNVVTFKNLSGTVLGEGRISQSKLQSVKKQI